MSQDFAFNDIYYQYFSYKYEKSSMVHHTHLAEQMVKLARVMGITTQELIGQFHNFISI